MESESSRRAVRWPVYLALLLLVVFALIFVFAFIIESENVPNYNGELLSAETYMHTVAPLLAEADPARGEQLIAEYECHVCHRAAAGRLAPSFEGIAARAAARRPPLTAAAYLYESIIHPGAYVVEGYADAMIKNYAERLTNRQLGDLIAYLLSEEAH